MPIASKLLYFQRRPSPAPPDPDPEPPDPRRRSSRDPSGSGRQRRRSSFSSHHKAGQELLGNQRDAAKSLGPAGNTAEHAAGISSNGRLNRSVSDHGRLPDAVQQARERLLQRLNSVDLSGRRQKTSPTESETIWAGLPRPADFTSDCILGTLTNCFQPSEPVMASKVEEGTTEQPVSTDAEECPPISLFSEPVTELGQSACSRGSEGGDDHRSSDQPPAECSICLEQCGGGVDEGVLTQLRCGHVFHSACLERWLRSRGDCPYCRATVLGS